MTPKIPSAWMVLGLMLSGCTLGCEARRQARMVETDERELARISAERAVHERNRAEAERDEAIARAEIAEAELAEAKARAELREITRRAELEATP